MLHSRRRWTLLAVAPLLAGLAGSALQAGAAGPDRAPRAEMRCVPQPQCDPQACDLESQAAAACDPAECVPVCVPGCAPSACHF